MGHDCCCCCRLDISIREIVAFILVGPFALAVGFLYAWLVR